MFLEKSNYRLNPTVNGHIHLGHVLMSLINSAEAQSCGGKFIVRFDDNQRAWAFRNLYPIEEIEEWICKDLAWLKIPVDIYSSQLALEHEVDTEIERLFKELNIQGAILRGMFHHDQIPYTGEDFTYYPYAPYFTLEKVWLDYKDGIRVLIRGRDLITEFSLYNYFVDLLGLPRVDQVFLPRLRYKGKDGLGEVSKTAGNLQVATLREKGWKAEDVMSLLRVSVLKDSEKEFRIENIKTDPVIEESVIAEMESRIQGTARVSSSGSSTVTFVFPPR